MKEPFISVAWCFSSSLTQSELSNEFLQTPIPSAKTRAEGLPSREEENHLSAGPVFQTLDV
jgi:hypothetical protein